MEFIISRISITEFTKDCFFLRSMPLSQLFSPKNTSPRSPPLPPKNNHNKTKQKIRQVTDQKHVFKGQASFLFFFFQAVGLNFVSAFIENSIKPVPDSTSTININDRNWLSKAAGAILKIPTRFSTHLFKLPLNLTSRKRSRREL